MTMLQYGVKPLYNTFSLGGRVFLNRFNFSSGYLGDLAFTDAETVPDWAQSCVSQAVSAGLVEGFPENTLRPNQSVSRLELVTLIVRASQIAVDPKDEPSFSDADKIPSWGAPYVAAAAKAGLIQGRDNNEFELMATATRAESATMILSLLKHLKL